MGGLLQNGWWNDILSAQNLFTVNTSLFDVLWLYRAAFTLPPHMLGTSALRFLGINYRAQVWVNGVEVVSADVAVGAFRHFEVDVTQLVTPGAAFCHRQWRSLASMAVRYPLTNHDVDLGITFVDWAPPAGFESGVMARRGARCKQQVPYQLSVPFCINDFVGRGEPSRAYPSGLTDGRC